MKAPLFSEMTLEWRVRMRGFLTPTGLTVSLSTVLNSGTVVTLPQTRYHQGGRWPLRYSIPNSSSSLIVPSSHTSARLVKNSLRNPPVPGETPVGRLSKASFSPPRESTGCPFRTVAGRSLPRSTYLALRAAMTAGSSVLATPKEVSRLTALPISPLERCDRATFLCISFCSVSLFSFLLVPFFLLFLSSSLTLSTMRRRRTVPQSSAMAALNLPAT